LPNRPATAFGLTALALVIGAAPVFTPAKALFAPWWVKMVLVVASAGALWAALRDMGPQRAGLEEK
jgi:membrane protein implicated in regulation of membrane protease activity